MGGKIVNYQLRRNNLINTINDNSLIVLFSGEEVCTNADEIYDFQYNNNFYYLTGITQKNSALVIKCLNGVVSEQLYLLKHDPVRAKWDGDVLNHQVASELAMISTVKEIDMLERDLKMAVKTSNIEDIYLDLESVRSDYYQGMPFRKFVNKNYAELRIHNVFRNIALLRSVKDEQEIAMIRQAIAITKAGLDQAKAGLRPGMHEFQVEALFNYGLNVHGCNKTAFKTIAASGKNATVLHYVSNDAVIPEGSLMLLDLGARFKGYRADITRTYPVSGKFDERQKLLYSIVLNGQKIVIDAVKPGVTCNGLNQLLRDYYVSTLTQVGLIKTPEELNEYYWHGVSHSLGLDTHDVGILGDQPLVPGNVITVEPGLYIGAWDIGIRIEDDILVTDNGYENLSAAIAKEIVDLEV